MELPAGCRWGGEKAKPRRGETPRWVGLEEGGGTTRWVGWEGGVGMARRERSGVVGHAGEAEQRRHY